MDSFYGGKQGISFIIKDKFDSIEAMNEAFANASYDKTWYGEYCIISAESLNHVDNGKIFKRTAYHAELSGGSQYAEYLGRIVGPAGGIPNVQLEDIETLKDNFDALKDSFNVPTPTETIYYKSTDSDVGYTSSFPVNSVTPSDKLFINDANLIYKSGASYPTGTTPAFKYGFYTVQTNTASGSDMPLSTLGIGFEIPYVDFATPAINELAYTDTARITVTPINNFYYKYNFNIPAGAPGAYIGNIHSVQIKPFNNESVVTPTIYDIKNIKYNPGTLTPYTTPTSALNMAATNAAYSNAHYVLVGNFVYPTKDSTYPWRYGGSNSSVTPGAPAGTGTTGADLFYVSNDTEFPTLTTTYNESSERYELYANYTDQRGSQRVGNTGPRYWGVWANSLHGSYNSNTGVLTITPSAPDSEHGNLGVLSSADIVVTGNGNNPYAGKNDIYFYLYENTNSKWIQLGEGQTQNNANLDMYNIDTLRILGVQNTVYIVGQDKPDNNENIDTFDGEGDIVPWI